MKHNSQLFSLYFSIPFHMTNYSELVSKHYKSLKDRGWVETSVIEGELDIYDHIVALMSNDNPNSIGSTWEFDRTKAERRQGWGSHKVYQTKVGEEFVEWDIARIGLVLFDTEIGFLWYQLQVKSPAFGKAVKDRAEIEKILGFVCTAKELTRNERATENYELFSMAKSAQWETSDAEVIREFATKEGIRLELRRKVDLFEDVLYPTIEVLEIDSYFANRQRDGKLRPDKGIPFVYMMDSPDEEAKESEKRHSGNEIAVRLGRGYDKKYGITSEMTVYRPFEYSTWYSCVEGCANYVNVSEENKFFAEGGYQSRLSNYFYLFILCMGQYYSLLQFSREVSRLPIDEKKYSIRSNAAEDMLDKIHLFKLKNMYSQVGHITQHNGFYAYLKDMLRIDELHEELEVELEALYKMVAKKQEAKKADRYRIITIISALFVLIETVGSVMDLYEHPGTGNGEAIQFTVAVLLGIVLLGVVLWLMAKAMDCLWKRKK